MNTLRNNRMHSLETHHDRFSLSGHTHAGQVHALRLRLSSLDLQDLLTFRALQSGLFQTLGCVDLVHGVAHASVRRHLRDERSDDADAVAGHHLGQVLLQLVGDVFLALEGFVESEVAQGGADGVADIGAHLSIGIGQRIVGSVDLVANNL